MKLSNNAKKAIMLATLCSVAYFAVYIARNILSAVTPQMIELDFTESYIGQISSLYFVFYAVGQLINGIIGDKVKAVWMMTLGLGLAGLTTLIFPLVIKNALGATIIYALTGFFLSMIYAPMTKVISENMEEYMATRCSIGYTFASLFGSPAAGILAALFTWQATFYSSSIFLVVMAFLVALLFTVFEKRGIVKYNTYDKAEKVKIDVKLLIKRDIIKFTIVSILTGIIRTSVVFWLPTYISQYLNFSAKESAKIFTVVTLIISLTAFFAIFIYEKLGRRRDFTMLLYFIASGASFLLCYFISSPLVNIAFMVIAIMAANSAATILWSVYCPSMYDTGLVSTVTGFLDFASYMAAALANVLFANAATTIGWKNLLLVWTGIIVLGIINTILPIKRKSKK